MGCPASETPKHKERSLIQNIGFYSGRFLIFLFSLLSLPIIVLVVIGMLFNTLVLENKVNVNKLMNKVNNTGSDETEKEEPDLDTDELELVE